MDTNQMRLEQHEFPDLITISEREVDICGIKLHRNTKPPFCNLKESDFPAFIKDRHFLDLLRRLAINKKHGQHTCVMSAPGVGKTEVLKYFGFLLNIPVVLLSCSEETRATELEGKYVPNTKDARTFFEDKLSPAKRHLLKDSSKQIIEQTVIEIERLLAVHAHKDSIDKCLIKRNEDIIKNEGWNLENIEWVFSPGVLPRAIEDNALLILDEWNKVSPGVRELLNGVIAKPNLSEVYGASKFVSYANGGGEYEVGEHFMVVAAVNFPDPASARYPFHKAEMRRLDLQVLEDLSSKEAIERNVSKRTSYGRLRQETLAELKKNYALSLRATALPLASDRGLKSLLDIVESIVEQAAHVLEQVNIRQAQEITLVGARDIIFDFLFNVQFGDFTDGVLFALDHYFLNKIIDPVKRREVKTSIGQIVQMGNFRDKIHKLIQIYENKKQYPKEVLEKISAIQKLLGQDDIEQGVTALTQSVRSVYHAVPDKEKTIDKELELLEEVNSLGEKEATYFDALHGSVVQTQAWLLEYEELKRKEKSFEDFGEEMERTLTGVQATSNSEPALVEGTTINTALEKLHAAGEVIYYAPAKLNEALKKLGVSFSAKELRRMESLLAVDLAQVTARCKQLKEHTEGNKPPLLMALPKTLAIDGKETKLTIDNLLNIFWPLFKLKKTDLKDLAISSHVTEITKKSQWGGALVAYSQACIEGSKDKTFEEQKAHVQSVLPGSDAIQSDMYLAMVFHYLMSGEILMKPDLMRLQELDKDGAPLAVYCNADKLKLSSDYTFAHGNAGVGASSVFSLQPSSLGTS